MEQGVVPVGDIDIHYRRVGDHDGPVWVLVHGVGEDGSSWAEVQDLLAPHVTSYAIDVRGHGRTPLGEADGTLAQLAGDVLAFVEAVGPSVLVGFSMGGAITLSATSTGDPLVHRMIGLGTSSVVGRRVAESFLTDATAIEAKGASAAREVADRLLSTAVHHPPQDWAARRTARLDAVGDGAGYANGARAMASMAQEPLTPALGGITVPVDLLVGGEDEVCPRKAAEIIVEALPDARIRDLPGVGHFAAVEDPAGLAEALLSTGR